MDRGENDQAATSDHPRRRLGRRDDPLPTSVEIKETGAIEDQLARVDAMLRSTIVKKTLRRAGGVVKRAGRKRAPRSKQTGTRELWSEKTKADRVGVKEHADTITVAVRDYGPYFMAIVGATGQLSLLGEQHKLVAWGRETEVIIVGVDYLTPAADETKTQQEAVVIGTVTSEVEKLLKPV